MLVFFTADAVAAENNKAACGGAEEVINVKS
jgi:hypothetical protein